MIAKIIMYIGCFLLLGLLFYFVYMFINHTDNTFFGLSILNILFVWMPFFKIMEEYELRNDFISKNKAYFMKAKESNDPFFLLLHSFNEKTHFIQVEVVSVFDPDSPLFPIQNQYIKRNFLNAFIDSIEPIKGTLLAIGGELKLDYPANILFIECNEENWWQNFKTLSLASKVIFIIPELTKSLKEEIAFIKQKDLLSKVIFIMSPALPNSSNNSLTTKQVSILELVEQRQTRWNIIKNNLMHEGINLPDYNPNGKIFILNDDSTIFEEVELGTINDNDKLSIALQQVISKIKFEGLPFRDIYYSLKMEKYNKKPNSSIPGYDKDFTKIENPNPIIGITCILLQSLFYLIHAISKIKFKGLPLRDIYYNVKKEKLAKKPNLSIPGYDKDFTKIRNRNLIVIVIGTLWQSLFCLIHNMPVLLVVAYFLSVFVSFGILLYEIYEENYS